jgi:hypothetical protein
LIFLEQITVYLEQRIYKELRTEQYGFAKVVMLIYRRLLVSCKEQMLVFLFFSAVSFPMSLDSIRLFAKMSAIHPTDNH